MTGFSSSAVAIRARRVANLLDRTINRGLVDGAGARHRPGGFGITEPLGLGALGQLFLEQEPVGLRQAVDLTEQLSHRQASH